MLCSICSDTQLAVLLFVRVKLALYMLLDMTASHDGSCMLAIAEPR
jgi:hypothetical protein